MLRGREVLREIDAWLATARDELGCVSHALDAAKRETQQLEVEELRALCGLAGVRLELTTANVGDACDAAIRGLRAELAGQDERRQSLGAGLARNGGEREGLARERDRLAHEHDAALDALGDRARRARTRILGDGAIGSSRDRMKALLSKAAHAAKKARQAGVDRDAKRRAYEGDRLFGYLRQRAYATPEYRASNLARTLDGWIARRIGYDAARRNYELLLEIPTRLEQHAASLREEARTTRAGLRRDVMTVFAAEGIPALVADLGAARQRLAEVDDRLDAVDGERIELERTLAELTSSRDARTRAAVEAAARELRNLATDDLLTAARTTDSARDDDLVARIADIRTQRAGAFDRAKARMEDRERGARKVELGREIRRRFRDHGLDLRDFAFAQPEDMNPLFEGIAHGTFDLEGAWSWLLEREVERRCGSTWIGDASAGDDGFDLGGLFHIFGAGGLPGGRTSGGGFGLDDFIGGTFDGDWFDTGGSF